MLERTHSVIALVQCWLFLCSVYNLNVAIKLILCSLSKLIKFYLFIALIQNPQLLLEISSSELFIQKIIEANYNNIETSSRYFLNVCFNFYTIAARYK